MTYQFPSTFLWGASTAGHQIEGGNVNSDIWAMENIEGSPMVEPSGDACDSYHRYEEDIELLSRAGLDTYRFGVEWSRIEPEEGMFSRAEIGHYRRMAEACIRNNVTPIVTLNHFTVPAWFARSGAWNQDRAPELFERYTRQVVTALGDLVDWWVTFNEPNAGAHVVATGKLPLGANDSEFASMQAQMMERFAHRIGGEPGVATMALPIITPLGIGNVKEAHRLSRAAIKSIHPVAKVGWTLATADLQAAPGGEEKVSQIAAHTLEQFWELSKDDDFVGVQTYTREVIDANGPLHAPADAPKHQTGWEYYPQALGAAVRRAAAFTGVPVLITENGIATSDDNERIAHTEVALDSVADAMSDGINVLGYLHWSLLDNFEWNSGYAMTFGLIAFDPETFERHPKPSLAWLGQVARNRQIRELEATGERR